MISRVITRFYNRLLYPLHLFVVSVDEVLTLNCDAIKKELRHRSLKVSGSKKEIQERISEAVIKEKKLPTKTERLLRVATTATATAKMKMKKMKKMMPPSSTGIGTATPQLHNTPKRVASQLSTNTRQSRRGNLAMIPVITGTGAILIFTPTSLLSRKALIRGRR